MCVTKLRVKDCGDKVAYVTRLCLCVCEKVACERLCVTKLCVKDGVGQSCV